LRTLAIHSYSRHKVLPYPRVLDRDRYYESPAAACVPLGVSQPKLTKLIREGKLRSIKIGRTRLIEKTAAQMPQ